MNQMESATDNYTEVSEDFSTFSNYTPKPFMLDLVFDVHLGNLLLSLVLGIVWLTYLTYYNGRVFGFILTKLLNKFYTRYDYYLHFGSFTFSILTGKIMFREFIYADHNVTVRVADGWVQFRYWIPYKPIPFLTTAKNNLSSNQRTSTSKTFGDGRLSLFLNGLEIHFYNWISRYEQIDRLFDLKLFFGEAFRKYNAKRHSSSDVDEAQSFKNQPSTLTKNSDQRWHWRDLTPSININITSGKIAFGNRFVPSTMVFSFENAAAVYASTLPSNNFDLFLHTIKGNCENVKVSFVKSLDYSDVYEDPPRIMGLGFVVLQTSSLEYYYYQDELGFVPETSRAATDSNEIHPLWGTNVTLGKGTVFSYGPWADNQRSMLYKFFYPVDYQRTPVTIYPTAGERRIYTKFDLKVNTLHDATFDVLFMSNDVPNAMHLNFVKGSWFECTVPWLIQENGSTTTIQGQFLMIDSSTSLEYRPLFTSETLSFNANLHYPRLWSDHQMWEFIFRGSKSTLNLVFKHKAFIQDLINEWASREPNDFCHFVPYSYVFEFKFDDFGVNLTTNPHNWIDTSSQCEENCHISITGVSFGANFCLPFTEFAAKVYDLRFWLSGEHLKLKYYLPEQHTMKNSLQSLFENSKVELHGCGPQSDIWMHASKGSDGWFDCWAAPAGTVTINYSFHAMPITHDSGIPTDVQVSQIDPSSLDPDLISVELEVGPSIVFLTAYLIKSIFTLKENYFGECDSFTDITTLNDQTIKKPFGLINSTDLNFDVRRFRPLHVKVAITLHEIQAHCLTYSLNDDSHCPVLFAEQFIFEMDKRFTETKLQLALSPVVAHLMNPAVGSFVDGASDEGRLMLSAFQMRAHAMFSSTDLPIDAPTVEYAWMMEFTLGELIGRVNLNQIVQIARFVDTLLTHLLNDEENLPYPKRFELCTHMQIRSMCVKNEMPGTLCETEHDLKYKFLRCNVDSVRLFVVNKNAAIELTARPIRAVNCTEHFSNGKEGITLGFDDLYVKQLFKYIQNPTPTTSNGIQTTAINVQTTTETWLECGRFELPKSKFDVSLPWADGQQTKRKKFMECHDKTTKRLDFLWKQPLTTNGDDNFTCGCYGGCKFYGLNSQGKIFGREFLDQKYSSLTAAAAPNLFSETDPAFGQSLLRLNESTLRNFTESPKVNLNHHFSLSRPLQATNNVAFSTASEIFFDSKENFDKPFAASKKPSVEAQSSPESDNISYVSTSSQPALAPVAVGDEVSVNLYSQINRPILKSPLLMTSYSKHLNNYSCNNWNVSPMCRSPSPSMWKASNLAPEFILTEQGINTLGFVVDNKNENSDTKNKNESKSGNQKIKRASSDPSAGVVSFDDVTSKSVEVSVNHSIRLFASPLSVEIIENFLAESIRKLSVDHPAYLVQKLFDKCSTTSHVQSLISPDSNFMPIKTASPMSLNVKFKRIEMNLFQCGVVEKIVPLDHIEQLSSLTPASIVVGLLQNFEIDAVCATKTDETPSMKVTLNVDLDTIYMQLLQIVEKGSPTIGISRTASKIPFETNWSNLNLSKNYYLCTIAESALKTLSLKSTLHPTLKSISKSSATVKTAKIISVIKEQPVAEPLPSTSSGIIVDERASSNESLLKKASTETTSKINIFLDNLSFKFGLCQPLETTAESWLLYDLISPSICAWLHVCHRLKSTATKLMDAVSTNQTKTMLFLLTEALDWPNKCSTQKSRFESAKVRRQLLRQCPSCQLALCLMRYCADAKFRDFEKRWTMPEGVVESKALPVAMVTLLSHWRDVLSAEHLVKLDNDRAKQFVNAIAKKRPPTTKKASVNESTLINIDSDLLSDSGDVVSVAEKQSLLPKSKEWVSMDSSFIGQNDPQKRASSVKSRSPQVPPSKRQDSGLSMSSSSAVKGGGNSARNTGNSDLKEDLYTWMAREQELDRKKQKNADGNRSGIDSQSEVNPIDLPLNVYFESFYTYQSLSKPRRRPLMFSAFGKEFLVDSSLNLVEMILVEPKLLHLQSTTGFKRITHTERPLLSLEDFTCSVVAAYQRTNKDPKEKKKVHQSIEYKMHLRCCTITAGFAPITFLNEFIFVARSIRDTIDEFESFYRKRTSTNVSISAENAVKASQDGIASVTPSGSTTNVKLQRTPSVATTAADYESSHWSRRLYTILRDYQRAKKISLRKTAGFSSPMAIRRRSSGEPYAIKSTVLGVVDCQMVELSAVFTEIFVNTSFTRVEFNHSSVDCWALVVGDVFDINEITKLISSDKSLKCSVNRVSSRLAETHAMQQNFSTILQMTIEQSQTVFTRQLTMPEMKPNVDETYKNSLQIEIGPIAIDIPLDPGFLHDVVMRGQKNLSERISMLTTPQVVEEVIHVKRKALSVGKYSRILDKNEGIAEIHFEFVLKGLDITAALLPSLRASYGMSNAKSAGVTGREAGFTIDVVKHYIVFDVKELAQQAEAYGVSPKIEMDLPALHARGAYIHHYPSSTVAAESPQSAPPTNLVVKEGGYLRVEVEVGSLRHTLTTDLLNQLLFIQEAFMRELVEIINKIASEKKPTTTSSGGIDLWSQHPKKSVLYLIEVVVQNIQITATTPTSTAVRLETDQVRIQFSNRFLQKSTKGDTFEKVFGVAEITVAVSLGQLTKNAMYEELEPEFQQFANFKTDISMRNVASHDAHAFVTTATSMKLEETRTYLINLRRPVLFIQPTAVDKAILLWLNYRNTYEFWNEQRKQIKPKITVVDRQPSVFEHLGSPPLPGISGPLFLQVNIDDGLYIGVPLQGVSAAGLRSFDETSSSSAALLISLQNTSIAVCSCGCLVSRGRFNGFCIKFIEDFDAPADGWRPHLNEKQFTDVNLNACYVPEGTYDICSKTISAKDEHSAEWILNIGWQMKGLDMKFNTRIGKLSSLLISTLTSLAGDYNPDPYFAPEPSHRGTPSPLNGSDNESEADDLLEDLPAIQRVPRGKNRTKMIESQMHEQAKLVNNLITYGASEATIEIERRRLQRLEAALYSEFRREMVEKLRKQGEKATTSFRDRIGLAVKKPSTVDVDRKRRQSQQLKPESALFFPPRRHSEATQRKSWRQNRTSSVDISKDRKLFKAPPASFDVEDLISPIPSPEHEHDDDQFADETATANHQATTNNLPENGSAAPIPGSPRVHQTSPAVNLYLDVKIYVDSGECTFQTVAQKSTVDADGYTPKNTSRTTRSMKNKLSNQLITNRFKAVGATPTTSTKIALPGLSVKSFYASQSGPETASAALNPALLRAGGMSDEVVNHMISSSKKGQFFLCLSLEGMPAETIVSPHILDFLEQTLEPIPLTPAASSKIGSINMSAEPSSSAANEPATNAGASETFNLEAASSAVSSFPVDVVVYINVQSSNIRFTSQPFSMVECLLRLPKLQMIGTSKKSSDLLLDRQTNASNVRPNYSAHSFRVLKEDHRVSVDEMLTGGISVTIMLTDFSLYVFHPYGTTNVGSATLPGGKPTNVSSAGVDRRDALSVSVKEITANIARSRNVLSIDDNAADSTAATMNQSQANKVKNSVKFSLLIDISTAQFKYDMRRLTEILSFPKAWYRRTIVRRLFFGDETIAPSRVFTSTPSIASTLPVSRQSSRRNSAHGGTPIVRSPTKTVPGNIREIPPSSSEEDVDRMMPPSTSVRQLKSNPVDSTRARWEALVLFGINFNELTLEAMMGQAMGLTTFKINGATSQGHINVNSEGTKNVYLMCGMNTAILEAKQGMVSGMINLNSLEAFGHLRDAANSTPQHEIGASLKSSEMRIDWMTSTVFIGKVAKFQASLHDDWSMARSTVDRRRRSNLSSVVEQSFVRVLGDIRWESMMIMITKTTVSDLIRIYNKLFEFFEQQLNSGRMFLVMEPARLTQKQTEPASTIGQKSQKSETDAGTPVVELRYHRHWQKALELVTGIQLAAQDYFPLPTESTIVGGTIEFSCGEMALSCFHGPNFMTPQWVIFYLSDVDVNFSVDAKDIVIGDKVGAKVEQNLTFRLGKDQIKRPEQPMATVLRVSRSGPFYPPQGSSIEDWLSYTFTSVLSESCGLSVAATSWTLKSGKNIVNFLFKLPALRINQRTEHMQSADTPTADDSVPLVNCAFVADFDGYLLLSQEIDALVTLADLVRSYLAEKQPLTAKPDTSGTPKKSKVPPDPTEELQKDGRHFETRVWQVAPQINFITLSERGQMERFEKILERGVEQVFSVMGFKEPSKTIPKWIQRGVMDPVDSLMATLVERLLILSKKH